MPDDLSAPAQDTDARSTSADLAESPRSASRPRALARGSGKVAVVAAAAYLTPVAFLAGQWPKRPAVVMTVLVGLVATIFGLLVWRLLAALGTQGGWIGGSAASLVFMNWARLTGLARVDLSPLADAAVGVLVAIAVGLGAARFLESRLLRSMYGWVIVGLAVGGLVGLAVVASSSAAQLPSERVSLSAVSDPPDIFFVVLDGYARADVLEDVYGFDTEPFLDSLESQGFTISHDAHSEYSMTYVSLASSLMMRHLIEPGRPLGEVDRVALYEVMAGENTVVASLQAAGYDYVHIESGWGGTSCGPRVDVCISTNWTETLEELTRMTPIADLAVARFGSAFSHAATQQLRRLPALADREPGRPRFVFTHVILPHAPLFVREDCEVVPTPDLQGLTIGGPGVRGALLATRRAAYVDQVACANRLISEFLAQVPDSSIVILASDHGPDSLGQLYRRTGEWTEADLAERMSILNAVRAPGCDTTDAYGIDMFAVIFRCVFSARVELHEDRQLLINIDDLYPDDPVVEVPLRR